MSEKLFVSSEIKQMKAIDTFKGIFVTAKIAEKKDKNGRPYWELSVMDSKGMLEAKAWSDTKWLDATTPSAKTTLPHENILGLVGSSVGINGKVAEFNGKQQINFTSVTLLPQADFPPTDYVRRSPFDGEILKSRFNALIDECDEPIKGFLQQVFSGKLFEDFCTLPAAVSNHHAYALGLLEHTAGVGEVAAAMAATYAPLMKVNKNLVIAGALLHDIGKLSAYRMTPAPEITLSGAVLDHVALGYVKFTELAQQYSLCEAHTMELGHIVLSHHGLKEYGSPVLPATPEAMIVSAADELDFRLFCWNEAFLDMPKEQVISPYNQAAARRFWRGTNGDDTNAAI